MSGKTKIDMLVDDSTVVIVDAYKLINTDKAIDYKFFLATIGFQEDTEIVLVENIVSNSVFQKVRGLFPREGKIRIEPKGKSAYYISPIILFSWTKVTS